MAAQSAAAQLTVCSGFSVVPALRTETVLTSPRVPSIVVLSLLAALTRSSRGHADVGGASASRCGGGRRGRWAGLNRLIQGGTLPLRVLAGTAGAWGGPEQRMV